MEGSAALIQRWKEETSLVPSKATCQCYHGVQCDGMDSFVNNVPQGSGLCFTDSPGDVFIMQKTCREKTTWLLVWQSAINHSHLLWGSGESGWIKSKVKCDVLADGRRLPVHACCRHERIAATVAKLWLMCILLISCISLCIISFFCATYAALIPLFFPNNRQNYTSN